MTTCRDACDFRFADGKIGFRLHGFHTMVSHQQTRRRKSKRFIELDLISNCSAARRSDSAQLCTQFFACLSMHGCSNPKGKEVPSCSSFSECLLLCFLQKHSCVYFIHLQSMESTPLRTLSFEPLTFPPLPPKARPLRSAHSCAPLRPLSRQRRPARWPRSG